MKKFRSRQKQRSGAKKTKQNIRTMGFRASQSTDAKIRQRYTLVPFPKKIDALSCLAVRYFLIALLHFFVFGPAKILIYSLKMPTSLYKSCVKNEGVPLRVLQEELQTMEISSLNAADDEEQAWTKGRKKWQQKRDC